MKILIKTLLITWSLTIMVAPESFAQSDPEEHAESPNLKPVAEPSDKDRFESDYGEYLQLVANESVPETSRTAVWHALCKKWMIEETNTLSALGWNAEKKHAESGASKNITAHLNEVPLNMIWIPSGSFKMGSDRGAEDEKPIHTVTITSPFWMASTEVTVAQWKSYLEETRYTAGTDLFDNECPLALIDGSFKRSENAFGTEWDQPMVEINWSACIKFCEWLTEHEKEAGRLPEGYVYSLPTEAQWEYACRALIGGDQEGPNFHYGNKTETLSAYAWYTDNSEEHTHPVTEKKPNAWGIFGMHGNAWEWCLDTKEDDFYKKSPENDPFNSTKSSYRVIRGGGWLTEAEYCRSANRGRVPENSADSNLGFRICLTRAPKS